MDAFAFGTRTTPEDSYRYAMGETVEYMGKTQKRIAPLDFLAVTDHAEYLGVVRDTIDPNGPFAKSEWYTMMTNPDPKVSARLLRSSSVPWSSTSRCRNSPTPNCCARHGRNTRRSPTSTTRPESSLHSSDLSGRQRREDQNLHRCVIFADKGPAIPFTAFDSLDPEALWRYLEPQRKLGLDVIAVPHNGNASNGLMFSTKDMSGKPIDARLCGAPHGQRTAGGDHSGARGRVTPARRFRPPTSLPISRCGSYLIGTDIKAKSATGSYLRQAYGVGQELQAKLGVNPFKYGIEAGTDFHSGITSTEPSNYPGSHGNQDSDPATVITATTSVGGEPPTALSSGGLTGVWAEENTRESIFAAFKRKETFGTSGTRIKVRMFAGWNYPKDMTQKADWVKAAYDGGVPMGGDLTAQTGSNCSDVCRSRNQGSRQRQSRSRPDHQDLDQER